MEKVTLSEIRTLNSVHLFADLDDDARADIAARCRWQAYEEEEIVIDAEQQDTDVYFLVKGLLRVVNYGVNGKEVSFIEIKGGNVFGEMSAIDGKARSAMVVALKPSLVANMSTKAFQQMVKEYPNVAWALLRQVTMIARGASERVMRLSTTSANSRVFNELLRQAEERDRVRTNLNAPLVLTPAPLHSDIAARVSTTRETVARAFSMLVKREVLKRVPGGVEVMDLDALREAAEEEV